MLVHFLFAFRIVNALLVQSQFDPDEFWQAGEPAHLLVFGNGHLTWEWAPNVALRSWIHPLLLTMPMWMLKTMGWDSSITMLMWPRIFLQVPLLVWSDWSVCEMAKRLGGGESWACALTVTNWFMFYCGVRTYSNSFEACVLMGILNLWPHNRAPSTKVLVLAAFCITIRPTSIISFAVLGLWYAYGEFHKKEFWRDTLMRIIPTLLICLAACAAVDSLMYGKPVFVLYNFVQFNLVRNVAVLYGTHAWYWYFALCFPAILGIQLPVVVYGVVKSSNRSAEELRLVALIVCNLVILSLSPHKELRFALPCIPPALVLASVGLNTLAMSTQSQRRVKALMVLGGTIPALYLSLVHQRAALDVALYLGTLPTESRIDVLLPCHSIPHYAVVHHRMAAFRFLDCSPRLPELNNTSSHHNETYLFHQNPALFLSERYSSGAQQLLPTVIVTQAKHADIVQRYLISQVAPTQQTFAHGQDNEDIIVFK